MPEFACWDRRVALGSCGLPSATRRSQRSRESRGWYSRGYLPHVDGVGLIQHITFHLADSLPREAIARMQQDWLAIPKISRPRSGGSAFSPYWTAAWDRACSLGMIMRALSRNRCYSVTANVIGCWLGWSCPIMCTCLSSRRKAGRSRRSCNPGNDTRPAESVAWDRRVVLGTLRLHFGSATIGTGSSAMSGTFRSRSNISRIIRLPPV